MGLAVAKRIKGSYFFFVKCADLGTARPARATLAASVCVPIAVMVSQPGKCLFIEQLKVALENLSIDGTQRTIHRFPHQETQAKIKTFYPSIVPSERY